MRWLFVDAAQPIKVNDFNAAAVLRWFVRRFAAVPSNPLNSLLRRFCGGAQKGGVENTLIPIPLARPLWVDALA
jgi:hypothetical protein